MANKDYDDLLESFMNNSQKVYNDDKDQHKEGQLPSSYKTFSNSKDKKENVEKKKAASSKAKQQARSNKPQKKNKKQRKGVGLFGRIILGIIIVCAVVGIVCASVIAIYSYAFVHGDPVFDLDDEASSQNQTSIIYGYDAKGKTKEITRLHGEENRIWLESDDMTPYLSKAFIAIEDERFESHHGVDWRRVVGVIVKPSNAGQGGSTITQQLIKNLTDENEVTIVRKFNEILSALNIEKNYSKEDIMEAYLNTIYLSHGCYGAKTAAETYFGKDVKDLNIAECACLAGITQFPTKFDPIINPENNKEKQERILKKMYEQGFITKQEYDEAVSYKLILTTSKEYKGSKVTKKAKKKSKEQINSYYTDYVIDQVISDLQKMGYSSKKARNMIYGGGLKIYSAIDFDVQDAIEDVYENYRRMPDESVQGACVVMDYKGRILGLVGGTGKKKANRVLNRAWQSPRQPGSTIKPLSVYGPAIEKSLTDDEVKVYWSTATKDAPLLTIDGKGWPTNEGGGYSGNLVSVQYGLSRSLNTISAQTLDKIGTSYSYDFITNKFHITSLELSDCDYAPMATGAVTNGISVLEMTTAYQAFGNGGYYYEGYSYYKVENSKGEVLIEKEPKKTREVAMTESSAWIMNKMLQTTMTEGTGTPFKLYGIECFGKTGTTTDDKDRWFMGGTPEYVGGVWYGYDQPKEVHYYQSSNPAGTLWNAVMRNIYDKKKAKKTKFPKCDDIVMMEYSLANGGLCYGSGKWGWFDKNNLPFRTNISGVTNAKDKTKPNDNNKSTTKNNNNPTTQAPAVSSTTQAETTTTTTTTTVANE